jgi:hypothetical protein
MCIICCTKNINDLKHLTNINLYRCRNITTIPYIFINLINLNCSGCNNLQEIPNTLVNLTHLSCYNCPVLTNIPDTLLDLINLKCWNCPLLTEIPDTLVNLTDLDCSSCSKLIKIPDKIIRLDCSDCILTQSPPRVAWLYCDNCQWLPQKNPEYTENIKKLLIIQNEYYRRKILRLKKIISPCMISDVVNLTLSYI